MSTPDNSPECCVCYTELTKKIDCNLTCKHPLCIDCCRQLHQLACPMCRRKNVFENTDLSCQELRIIKKRRLSNDNAGDQVHLATSSSSYEEEISSNSSDSLERAFRAGLEEHYLREYLSDSNTSTSKNSNSEDSEDCDCCEHSVDYPDEESDSEDKEKSEKSKSIDPYSVIFLSEYDFFPDF